MHQWEPTRILTGLSLLLTLAAAEAVPGQESARAEKKIDRALEQGYRSLARRKHEIAIARFEQARELSGGEEPVAFVGLAEAYLEVSDYAGAVQSARTALELSNDVEIRVNAFNLLGLAHYYSYTESADPRQEDLLQAERSFRRFFDLSRGSDNVARFNLAMVLYRLQRHGEALAHLKQYLDKGAGPADTAAAEELMCFLEAETAEEPLLAIGQGSAAPAALESPPPKATKAARAAGVAGEILARVLIDEAGSVECVEILKGLPHGLNEATLSALKKWKLESARRDDVAVRAFVELTVSFELR